MKLIHCSDLHLDSALRSNLTQEKAKMRNVELCTAFGRLVDFAREERVEAVLIAGDLFDSPYVSRQTADYVREMIRGAGEITFFRLRGNHDECTAPFLEGSLPDNLKTFGPQWTSFRCGSAVITGMEPEGDGWFTMYDSLRLNQNDLNIVMLHGQMATQPGKELIALPLLEGKNIRYLALGHLHTYSKGSLGVNGEYAYSGCLEGRGFDECGEKGFVLLETDGSTVKSRFVPFAERTLHELVVDISGAETVTQILSLLKQASSGIGAEDLVKIILSGSCKLQTQKDADFLRKMLEQDFWFVKIKDETRLEIDEKSYEYDVSLKGEFVRSVLASNRSEEEKMRIIACGIRALNGEEVLP